MSTYYIGGIVCDSNYLEHKAANAWGKNKSKKDYALTNDEIDRRRAMRDKQDEKMQRLMNEADENRKNGNSGFIDGETEANDIQRRFEKTLAVQKGSSTKVGSMAQNNGKRKDLAYLNNKKSRGYAKSR